MAPAHDAMLPRLMFVYFLQKWGLLDGDRDYLSNRLHRLHRESGPGRFHTFYRHLLGRLFRERPKRRAGLDALLGDVPFLNGGALDAQEWEKCPGVDVPDEAFERLFSFFDRYQWNTNGRPPEDEQQITPDAIGYVFEMFVNRREMGAYYTQDDITEYIARNTIIPFLLERAAVFPSGRVGQLLSGDPDRYLFDSLRHGGALPTENRRERTARMLRYRELCRKLRAGGVSSINELVTYNLDLRRFAVDFINGCDDPTLLRAFWEALRKVTVLDPTCGSGAFLFAALNVLAPLYEACLERMQALGLSAFADIPNRRLFVLKSIVVNNLYGVDLMREAVEVCKLRLLLRLIAEAQTASDLGALADVDFNLRGGDALAGAEECQPFRWRDDFAGVLSACGFDVVIGNPPYVECARAEKKYRVQDYKTITCGNLYALVVERSFSLLGPRGRAGMIVPHSAFCTDRMAPLMRLFGGRRATWVSTYDIRPSKLFAGVDQRLAIYLTAPAPCPQIFGTRYHRWHEPARANLFRTLGYADVSEVDYPNAVAKIGSETELRLWKKLRGRAPLVGDLGGRAVVYYHNAPRYWVRAMTFAPYFRNERDGVKRSTQVKTLPVRTAADAGAVAAALNSSLFYWWFVAFSDSRHLNRREIDRFPLGLAGMSDADRRELASLCGGLMKDYRRNAVRKECRYKTTGRVVYDEYYPRRSKGIIDEIDRVLARHLDLDGDELDFVLNFDLKYRCDDLGGTG